MKLKPKLKIKPLTFQAIFLLLFSILSILIAIEEIRELIKHIKDRGVGVLITDHNVKETLEIIDKAYIMHEGKILMYGKPNEIIEDENVRRVYLGQRFNL